MPLVEKFAGKLDIGRILIMQPLDDVHGIQKAMPRQVDGAKATAAQVLLDHVIALN